MKVKLLIKYYEIKKKTKFFAYLKQVSLIKSETILQFLILSNLFRL